MITPAATEFNKQTSLQTDAVVKLAGDSSNLIGITHGTESLIRDMDFVVAGKQVTIKKEYLANLPVGRADLTFHFRGDHKNDVHYAEADGSSFAYTFKGTGFDIMMAKGPELGIFDIYLDDVYQTTVDTEADDRMTGQTVYSIAGLENRVHTVKVIKKSGEMIVFDALKFHTAATTSRPENPGTGIEPGNEIPTPKPEKQPEQEQEPTKLQSAYITGYQDGTFRPDATVTRFEIAALMSRVLTREETAAEIVFRDVPTTHWAYDAINKVVKMGLIGGYQDGSFKGERPITRAELASILSPLAPEADASRNGLTDLSGHWAEQAINRVQAAGYMKGYQDGKFRPNQTLTRAEAVTVINRVIGRAPIRGIMKSSWKDVRDQHWALGDIEAASLDHIR